MRNGLEVATSLNSPPYPGCQRRKAESLVLPTGFAGSSSGPEDTRAYWNIPEGAFLVAELESVFSKQLFIVSITSGKSLYVSNLQDL